MTPRGERSARTCREMERGREMVERSTRSDLIDKWEKGKKILVARGPDPNYKCAYGDRPTLVSIGRQTFREPSRSFPSKQMIADIYLALEFSDG